MLMTAAQYTSSTTVGAMAIAVVWGVMIVLRRTRREGTRWKVRRMVTGDEGWSARSRTYAWSGQRLFEGLGKWIHRESDSLPFPVDHRPCHLNPKVHDPSDDPNDPPHPLPPPNIHRLLLVILHDLAHLFRRQRLVQTIVFLVWREEVARYGGEDDIGFELGQVRITCGGD